MHSLEFVVSEEVKAAESSKYKAATKKVKIHVRVR